VLRSISSCNAGYAMPVRTRHLLQLRHSPGFKLMVLSKVLINQLEKLVVHGRGLFLTAVANRLSCAVMKMIV